LKLFIVLGFAIMFVAGLEVGRSHTTLPALREDFNHLVSYVHGNSAPVQPQTVTTTKPEEHRLFGKIVLTNTQNEQIQKIFGDARTSADLMSHQFAVFDQEKEDLLLAMLDPDQKLQYVQILHERDAKIASLRAEISATWKKAAVDVRAQLDPDQQKQFDDFQRQNPERGHRGGRGNPGHGGHPHGGPETAPVHATDAALSK
jgi:hypothetical protein